MTEQTETNNLRAAISNRFLNADASGVLLERLSQPRVLRLAEEFEKECEGRLVELAPYLATALKVCSHMPPFEFSEERDDGAGEPMADELEEPVEEIDDLEEQDNKEE